MNQKIQELIIAAKSDPKKSGVLGALMLALAVLGAKQFLGAEPNKAAAQDAVDAVRNEVLGLSDIGSIVVSGPSIEVPATEGRMRDLFRFDQHHFPAPVLDGEDVERSGKSDVSTDDPKPVDADPAASELERIRAEAERFRLTSTLLGSNPIALIDLVTGRNEKRSFMLRIGEDVRGFTLVSVSHRAAVIEYDGHQFTLNVQD